MTLGDWLWAIPVFGLLIFIHELGHFAVAKYFDFHVQEFALGFGPVLVGWGRGETRYNLRLVPLGGYVRMAGTEEGESEDPRGFNKKPVLMRAAVIAAGPIMNFALAAALFAGFQYVTGSPDPLSVLGGVAQQCQVMGAGGQATMVTCPSYQAGLQPGDRVIAINGKPVSRWEEILRIVTTSDGKPLAFRIQRGSETKELTMTPVYSEGRWVVGILQAVKKGSLVDAVVQGPRLTWEVSKSWVVGLWEMVSGRIKPQLSGPVGITREIAQQAAQGWDNLLWLTAFLSINLGMFNLLPIPALDGARLLFMGVEVARGRRLDPQRENMVHFVGFLLLIGLMLVVTYGEIVRR